MIQEYIGIDLIPEQIDLAHKRCVGNYSFMYMDAVGPGKGRFHRAAEGDAFWIRLFPRAIAV